MRNFWALPVFLRLSIAAQQQAFNVNDDLHTFPQYEIIWRRDSPVSDQYATEKLNRIHSSLSDDPSSHSIPQHHTTASPDTSSSPLGIASYESILLSGQRYLCSIPVIPPAIPSPPSNKTADEEANELSVVINRGEELLKGMEGHCIYYISGWWSYSFCYNEGVRQFHPMPSGRNVPALPPVEDKSVGAYVLGRFNGKEKAMEEEEEDDEIDFDDDSSSRRRKKPVKRADEENQVAKLEVKGQKGSTRYLVHHLKGGTKCDLTGEERSIEVQFRCDNFPADRISIIKETSICQYRMVISTPRLCNDVAFQPPKGPKPHPVTCHPVISEEALPAYLSAQEALEAEAEAENEEAANEVYQAVLSDLKKVLGVNAETEEQPETTSELKKQQNKPVIRVGDIEVGAHNIVPEDLALERGVVVGGTGREKLIGTIARSDGYTASEKELAKMNIHAGKELEVIKDKVRRTADGAEWQIDVVETARGKELRGIIGEKESKETKGKIKGKKPKDSKEKAKGTEDSQRGKNEETAYGDEDDEDEGSEETYKEEL